MITVTNYTNMNSPGAILQPVYDLKFPPFCVDLYDSY